MKKTNLSKALRRLREDERRGARVHRLTLRGIALQRRVSKELADELPHELWQWLSDFDVRKKSAEVAVEQNAFIDELISRLESGQPLGESETAAPAKQQQNLQRRVVLTVIACLATAAAVTELLRTRAAVTGSAQLDAGFNAP